MSKVLSKHQAVTAITQFPATVTRTPESVFYSMLEKKHPFGVETNNAAAPVDVFLVNSTLVGWYDHVNECGYIS
jgi:hypothetical protein